MSRGSVPIISTLPTSEPFGSYGSHSIPSTEMGGFWVDPGTGPATPLGFDPSSTMEEPTLWTDPPVANEAVRTPGARLRIPHEARAILDRWFRKHQTNPYVEKDEAEELSHATGLTVRQVRTYFANARARRLPPTSGGSPSNSPELRTSWSPSIGEEQPPPLPPRPAQSQHESGRIMKRHPQRKHRLTIETAPRSSSEQQSPMERYLSSSSEDEGLLEDIVRKAAGAAFQAGPGSLIQDRSSDPVKSPTYLEAPHPMDTFSESASSCGRSIDTAASRGPRKGRKRQPNDQSPQLWSIVRRVQDAKKIYQCTFCVREFMHKYDWRRHEESVHFPQQEWVCMPDNNPIVQSPNGSLHCAFCDRQNPSQAHFDVHNCEGCLGVTPAQRTFTRKDKLLQHIGQVHKRTTPSPHISNWSRPVERNVSFRCGICGLHLHSWSDRIEHIASHFAAGQDMRYWKGERGLIQPVGAQDDSSVPEATSEPRQYYMCKQGCRLQFSNLTELIYHERQAHDIYEEQVSGQMHSVVVAPAPAPAPPAAAAPSPLPLPPPPPLPPRRGMSDSIQTYYMESMQQRSIHRPAEPKRAYSTTHIGVLGGGGAAFVSVPFFSRFG
jgi:hypothetical protein